MVSELNSGLSCPGSSPAWGHCVLRVPLSTQVYKWVTANLMLGLTLRWTSIPSRKEKKYSKLLHSTETGGKRWQDGPLGHMQTYFMK